MDIIRMAESHKNLGNESLCARCFGGWGLGVDMKERNKVLSVHDDSQKETEARMRGKWSSDLRQQFKMGKKPSSHPGPGQKTAFQREHSKQKCSPQQESSVFQKLAERQLRFPALCQLPPLAIPPLHHPLSSFRKYSHALDGEIRSH